MKFYVIDHKTAWQAAVSMNGICVRDKQRKRNRGFKKREVHDKNFN